MEVPAHYSPREYQAEFLSEIRDRWFVVMEWARRAGKGLTTFVYATQRMVEEPMGVMIVYPTAKQGYRSFWNNIENDGFRTIEHIPDALVARKTSTEESMSIVLKNGSTLDLVGANANPETLRGNNIKLYILSEFVDIDSGILDIIEPIVVGNGGQIIVESTPKIDGISGATFVKLLKEAEKDPEQYGSRVPANLYMTNEQLERARKACIVKWGNDFMFRQEYLLDEGQALETSYYGNIIAEKQANGLIGLHKYNPDYPVYTSWDLGGGSDATAGVFWQYYNKRLTIIDFYETAIIDDKLLVSYILSKPYIYGYHFFPHDGAKRDSDGIDRLTKLQQYGLIDSALLIRRGKEAGLKDAVQLVRKPTVRFHQPFTQKLLDKIILYKRQWNPHTGDYMGAEHKTESHAADAVRYMSDAIKQFFREDGSFMIKTRAQIKEEEYAPDNWAEVDFSNF